MLNATQLRCEYRVNPLGIDQTAPRFDWRLQSDRQEVRGQCQTAYQIIVESPDGVLWDSGKVESEETTQIVYRGSPLRSRQQASWKVRVWNGSGEASNWSDVATFSMGLLSPSDWQAKWIGRERPATMPASAEYAADSLTLEGLDWLWSGQHRGTREFRKIIHIEPTLRMGQAIIACTGRFELFVNGESAGFGNEKSKAYAFEITPLLHEGDNDIKITATNNADTPAGLIGRMRIRRKDQPGSLTDINNTWTVADKQPEVVARYGDAPFGKPAARELVLPPPSIFWKGFGIDRPIRRATLYASALGVYVVMINGQRVGAHELSPGWTEYSKRVHYDTYDVTKLLRANPFNDISAFVGDGWYAGYLGYAGKRDNYGTTPKLIAQLEVEFADGTKQIVVSDESWKTQTFGLLEADLLMGCRFDARIAPGNEQPAIVSDHVSARLQANPGPPVQRISPVAATKVTQRKPGTYVFDLAQNIVGWVALNLPDSKPGQTVQLRYAEMLNPDGSLYTTALRSARATDTYIGDGEAVKWQPMFTFHGFRYVEVSGLDREPGPNAITGIVVHSEMTRSGEFECSNPLINQLVQNIIWGQKGNYLSIPTDCPQRDERLGWTGDAQFFIPTGSYNFDVASFFTKWLIDLNEDSANAEGAFASVAPDILKVNYGATAWADAGIVCPYVIYKMYGDQRVIESHWTSMTKYIDYLQSTSKDFIRGQHGYGDWLNLGGGAKSEVLGTAYSEHVTRLMSEMASILGREEESKKYRVLADKIRDAFIKNFVTDDGHIRESSQTGFALAFAFDLLPENLRQKAADAFVAEIEKKDWHLATGFIGTPILLPALSRAGREDIAYRLLEQETFPGWLFQVKLGATTMWERWDGWTPDKGFQDPGMNSFNHYAFGSVGEFLYRSVGGIDTDGPAFKKIIIRPRPGGSLTHAKASYDSIHGPIVSQWKLNAGKFELEVSIPINTTATIHVPTSDAASVKSDAAEAVLVGREDRAVVYRVPSGDYRFSSDLR